MKRTKYSMGTSLVYVPIPETAAELKAQRTSPKPPQNIHSQVEDLFLILYDKMAFRRFFKATSNANAVEGSLRDDEAAAVHFLRQYALGAGNCQEVGDAKLALVRRSMRIAAKRHRITLKQRIAPITEPMPTTAEAPIETLATAAE